MTHIKNKTASIAVGLLTSTQPKIYSPLTFVPIWLSVNFTTSK
jgi:hypothetical protein